ncbi:hypothetical protein [Bacillus cereus]|nr:hypothetical protein [Bacillus cereus]
MNKYTFDDSMHVHLFYYKNIKIKNFIVFFVLGVPVSISLIAM